MSDLGYVKLHRKILEWEWWDDHNATRLLMYLLVKVNWEEKKWKTIMVKPGSLATSWDHISAGCGLSKQKVRTAMSKLEMAGEVTRKPYNKYQLVTLLKWDKLQSKEDKEKRKLTDKLTDNQQSNNNQITPTKEGKEHKEEKNNYLVVFEKFKQSCPDWPQIRKVSEARKKMINARVNEFGMDEVLQAIEMAGGSKFLTNGTEDRNWTADFDWLFKSNNMVKVLEGKYKNKDKPQAKSYFENAVEQANQGIY